MLVRCVLGRDRDDTTMYENIVVMSIGNIGVLIDSNPQSGSVGKSSSQLVSSTSLFSI